MKKIVVAACIGFSFLTFQNIQAQANRTHTIKSGESLSSIAPQYGTTVGDIMRLNGMNASSKLSVGQTIKIPAEGVHIASNINPDAGKVEKTADSATHTVLPGESLYRISRDHKISVENLRKWNNLPDNNIKPGQILKLSENAVLPEVPAKAETAPKTVTMIESAKSDPVTKTAETPVVAVQPAGSVLKKSDTTVISRSVPNGGFFAPSFSSDVEGKKLQSANGNAGVFQSQAGWTNGKYYMQMNGVTPGTIVKLTANRTSIYAKVLWNLSDSKENAGLQYRISDAAAAVLGLPQNAKSFPISIEYYE